MPITEPGSFVITSASPGDVKALTADDTFLVRSFEAIGASANAGLVRIAGPGVSSSTGKPLASDESKIYEPRGHAYQLSKYGVWFQNSGESIIIVYD